MHIHIHDAWEANKHPRGKGGKFAKKGEGGASAAAPAEAAKEKPKRQKADKPAAKPRATKTKAGKIEVDAALLREIGAALAQHHPELASKLAEKVGKPHKAKSAKGSKGKKAGKPLKIVTPDGKMEVEAQPQIVDLADLIHAEGDLQPRDRTTAESKITARQRAASLDPERLKPNRSSDTGAPIVTEDGTIISGNGRIMSIREAYENPEFADKIAAYRKSLGPKAEGMKQPVLISRLGPMTHEQLVEFADRSNRSNIESMSATERAKRDATAIGADVAGLYQGGDFTLPANKPFLHAFTMKAMTPNERAAFSKGGKITKEGVDRLNAAVLASAYDDTDTLSLMLESTDDNVRAITNAMRDTAGKFAQLKADIKAGAVKPDMDVTAKVADMAKLISHLRKNGVSPANHFAQIDAFNPPDPMVEALVKTFYNGDMTRAISQQKIAKILSDYAEEAMKQQPGGFFGNETTSEQVLSTAGKKTKGGGSELAGPDLFSGHAAHEQSAGSGGGSGGGQQHEGAGGVPAKKGGGGRKPKVAAGRKAPSKSKSKKPKDSAHDSLGFIVALRSKLNSHLRQFGR